MRCSRGREVEGQTQNQCRSRRVGKNPADCQAILGIIYFNAFLYNKKPVPIVERNRYDAAFQCFTNPPYDFFRNISGAHLNKSDSKEEVL